MRLLTFHGPTTDAVMADIRSILGPDAILVAERKDGKIGQVEILAASAPQIGGDQGLIDAELRARLLSWADNFSPSIPDITPASSLNLSMAEGPAGYRQAAIHIENQAASVFLDAGFSMDFAQRLANAMPLVAPDFLFAAEGGSPPQECAPAYSLESVTHAFSDLARFAPLSDIPDQPVLLVGPPGSGKSLTIVKLAARALAAGALPQIVVIDPLELGFGAPLAMFAKIAPVEIKIVRTCDDLKILLEASTQAPIFIDSWSINPLERGEISALKSVTSVVEECNSLTIGVIPAGLSSLDADDTIQMFALLGIHHTILTRCDVTRMPGAAIESIVNEGLSFSELGISSRPTPGLSPACPGALARLFPGLESFSRVVQQGENAA